MSTKALDLGAHGNTWCVCVCVFCVGVYLSRYSDLLQVDPIAPGATGEIIIFKVMKVRPQAGGCLSQHTCQRQETKPSVVPAVWSEDGRVVLSFASACISAHRVYLSTWNSAAFSLCALRPSVMCCRCGLELSSQAKQHPQIKLQRLSAHRGSSSSLLKFKFHPSLSRRSFFSPLCIYSDDRCLT